MTDAGIEKAALKMLEARGMKMKALPEDAIWLAYPKEQALAEARAAVIAYLEATMEPSEAMLHDATNDSDVRYYCLDWPQLTNVHRAMRSSELDQIKGKQK